MRRARGRAQFAATCAAGTTALALALSIRGLANDWTALQVATGRGWATRPAAQVAAN